MQNTPLRILMAAAILAAVVLPGHTSAAQAPAAQAGSRTERTVWLTAAGKAVVAKRALERNTLTPEDLESGAWREIKLRPYDVTLAARDVYPVKIHPLRKIIEQTRRAFLEMGFAEVVSPMIESAFWNFDALYQPQDHPARDMQDTFYMRDPAAAPPTGPRPPTMETAPAGISPSQAPDTVFIDELTWEETRDALKAGKTTVIIPTGGTEKNGYHMVLGKHNYVVTFAANVMARRLKTALVAPTIQYVPEGNPDSPGRPGVISHPSPGYDMLLDAAARSLKAHGFKDILFIGDSGGNQSGLTNVAAKLNEEWKGTDYRAYGLTDYYGTGREHYRAWLLAAYGYTDQIIGSHAGISDTSQLLFVRPAAVRKDQIKPWGGPKDSGVSGDPTKATAEIGKMSIEFKVNAAIAQFNQLKNPGRRGGGGGGRSRGRT